MSRKYHRHTETGRLKSPVLPHSPAAFPPGAVCSGWCLPGLSSLDSLPYNSVYFSVWFPCRSKSCSIRRKRRLFRLPVPLWGGTGSQEKLRRLSVSPSFCKDIPAALSCYAPSGLLSAGFIPCFREKVFPMLPRQVSGCFFGRVSFLYLVCRILKWDRKTGDRYRISVPRPIMP